MNTSYKPAIPEGTCICGKWNGRTYTIVRLLGEGANGQVFLVRSGKSLYAMKVGFDPIDLQMEVNVLRSLAEQSDSPEPFLLESDDAALGDREYPFYVMRYVKGVRPQEFLLRHGPDWFELILYHLLKKLSRLHRQGWVFGDLKTDNVLVSEFGKVELVDYGGVTEIGRSVKQYTEIYDRGYWNAGSRTADEAYDLFSFAVFCLQLTDSRKALSKLAQSLPQNRDAEDLVALVDHTPRLHRFKPVLQKALTGKYVSSAEAAEEWRMLMLKNGIRPFPGKPGVWIQTAFAVSLLLFGSTLYYFFHS